MMYCYFVFEGCHIAAHACMHYIISTIIFSYVWDLTPMRACTFVVDIAMQCKNCVVKVTPSSSIYNTCFFPLGLLNFVLSLYVLILVRSDLYTNNDLE